MYATSCYYVSFVLLYASVLYILFCHGALNLDMSTLYTTLSLQFILHRFEGLHQFSPSSQEPCQSLARIVPTRLVLHEWNRHELGLYTFYRYFFSFAS